MWAATLRLTTAIERHLLGNDAILHTNARAVQLFALQHGQLGSPAFVQAAVIKP